LAERRGEVGGIRAERGDTPGVKERAVQGVWRGAEADLPVGAW